MLKENKDLLKDPETKRVGCGCLTFIPIMITIGLINSGTLSGFWGVSLAFMVIAMALIIGCAVTGGFD